MTSGRQGARASSGQDEDGAADKLRQLVGIDVLGVHCLAAQQHHVRVDLISHVACAQPNQTVKQAKELNTLVSQKTKRKAWHAQAST